VTVTNAYLFRAFICLVGVFCAPRCVEFYSSTPLRGAYLGAVSLAVVEGVEIPLGLFLGWRVGGHISS